MTDIEINKKKDKAEVILEGEKLGDFNPQQIWDLAEELRDYTIANSESFSEIPIQNISVGNINFNVHPLNQPDFWNLVNKGDWEPETYAVFDRFIKADTVFLDIGAWIGSTSLYGAQLAKETHAFEPDPVAFSELKSNKEANAEYSWAKKLMIYPKAVSQFNGTAHLGSKNNGGDSMSSMLFADENKSWKVETIDLDSFLKAKNLEGQPLFIKMDIEGGEYELLPSLKVSLQKNKTFLFLSLHPEFLLQSIRAETNGKFRELKTRIAFFKKHNRLIKSLPYSKIQHADGRPINLQKQLIKALFLGKFPHTILGFS
ncbi:FkbM family methyltransferase [Cryomorpha ignava]|uniref:FkbM family methyltransferase n=1 Tax=Cryomorpha ignava TaxID=101383 RepID=A0A7K3WS38_9FLAO|nr:FkbM family methyltransferase [Cryomorpha ignava]NEN24328.1 FkbM family methyltransferase [Cryomorpha ignava]